MITGRIPSELNLYCSLELNDSDKTGERKTDFGPTQSLKPTSR
jgi:hypothetical protein